ncbi:MAG: kelch repeat-containing protein [Candidatus Aminicenantales bacterium]
MKRVLDLKYRAIVFLLLLSSACGVDKTTPITISVTPNTANSYVGEAVQFVATVRNSTNTRVTWSLSGTGCNGTACGTISVSGLYTAPANVPNPAVVTIKAVSAADNTKSASASITILDAVSNEWAWVSGSNIANQEGIYGTRGTASPENLPGARDNAISWVDHLGRLWLFGGGGHNDLWMYETTTHEWTWVSGSSALNQAGLYGTQGVPSPLNVPGARIASVSWIDSSGDLWLFGGLGTDAYGNGGDLSDLWRYRPETNEWTWVSGNTGPYWSGFYGTKGIPDPSNKPGARYKAVSWADSSGNLWLFGGQGYDSAGQLGSLNDLWKYNIAADEWVWVAGSDTRNQGGAYGIRGVSDTSNVPGARGYAVAWLDSQGKLWLFGGLGYDSTGWPGRLNDLWRFDPMSLEWTWISGSNLAEQVGIYGIMGIADPLNVPGGRSEAASWYDSDGRLWLFGGMGLDSLGLGDTSLNDLWNFDQASLEWTWVSGNSSGNQWGVYGTRGIAGSSNVPGARTGAVSWADSLGRLWMFGGNGFDSTGWPGPLNDLWKYFK